MIRFFTYGTFRQGECRNHILQGFNAEFLGIITTIPEYKLFNLGHCPAMIEGGDKAIVGELYNLPKIALSTLDIIESHPLYFRHQEIKLIDNTYAISYLFQRSTDGFDKIATNDWVNR
jgi:gamma-glutamylcyclotransferase (GGCT)/AIG2-like uncharacterized protein YtfP